MGKRLIPRVTHWVHCGIASLGPGQLPPCPALRHHGYIHTILTFPCALGQVPPGPGPEWGRGEDGQGWDSRKWCSWHQGPIPRRQDCMWTQTCSTVSLNFTYKSSKVTLLRISSQQPQSIKTSSPLCELTVWMPMNLTPVWNRWCSYKGDERKRGPRTEVREAPRFKGWAEKEHPVASQRL